jgi:hypothetical protein
MDLKTFLLIFPWVSAKAINKTDCQKTVLEEMNCMVEEAADRVAKSFLQSRMTLKNRQTDGKSPSKGFC